MLGIDINETIEVQIKDAVFIIGIIPYGIRIMLDSSLVQYSKDAIKEAVDAGQNPSAESIKKQIDDGSADSYADLMRRSVEYVKYGVKGHRGIADKNGKAIDFLSESENHGGREIKVVSAQILDMYFAMGLISQLYTQVFKINHLQGSEAKN